LDRIDDEHTTKIGFVPIEEGSALCRWKQRGLQCEHVKKIGFVPKKKKRKERDE